MPQTSPHNLVTSKENAVVKRLRSLHEPKHRKKEQAFLLEGVKMVEEAIRDNLGVEMVVCTPELLKHHGKGVLKLAESRQIDVVWISEKIMDSLSESKTPQPVMAVAGMRRYEEEFLFAEPASLIVIAHQLQDPGNLGTIMRTAEATGVSGLGITPGTVDPYHPKSIRASMGSILRLPVAPVQNLPEFLGRCRKRGFQTAATVLNGRKTHFELDLTRPTVVIFGQEGAGLPEDVSKALDLHVRIPMAETIDSLNVATAAAVVLYEAVRQRLHQAG
jgi:TrmH family RNA methyltransferase